ncbi:hypothetical protein [Aggregatibacter actinomycetemcomitans]|uniref:hypothetical protein n=1 Tax=Aggregatibacter actinomycetemcomitans TaxID=714 RepID=UPI0011D43E5C|nr:hypothetical protein [Aggregatibacter actinomycetemcomitans]TYB19621.1 hypothetical protein FXB71_09570 [Aggregatibacter actinomycetemcomitans]
MAYKTGTAKNERDLLDILNAFLTTDPKLTANGQAWTLLFDRTLPATATEAERRQITWKSTGTGIGQDIYIGAETTNNIAQDTYNINFYGGTFFNRSMVTNPVFTNGIVNLSPGVALCANGRDFTYHMVADGRHFKILTVIEKVCCSAYCGFVLPNVPPTEYPYPLCIAGCAEAGLTRFSVANDDISSIASARNKNCWLLTPDQSWRDFVYSDGARGKNADSIKQGIHPIYSNAIANKNILSKMAAINNHYPLTQVELYSTAESSQGMNRWGAMDGIYWLPGIGTLALDTIKTKDGRKLIVFNDAYRVTTTSYFAMEIE